MPGIGRHTQPLNQTRSDALRGFSYLAPKKLPMKEFVPVKTAEVWNRLGKFVDRK